jgi:pyruvate dehydrogenase E2 component (dihydrolipoamide acetyltransferase)
LLVPVVKGTDRMSVTEISGAIRTLATAARDGKIELPDLQGGTFTITNVGSLGGTFVIPTINYPEAAILGMGRVRERPVIRGGNVEARMILPLTLTFDHRIADGANAARFVTALTGYLSDPVRFLAEM